MDLNTIIQLAADFEYGILHNPKDSVNKSTCDRLFKMTSKQLKTGQYDALIVLFSCHGNQEQVILSDNKSITLRNIISYFNGHSLPQFIEKPKLFIFDYRRSDDMTSQQDELIPIIDAGDSKLPSNSDKYHPDCNIITIQPSITGSTTNDASKGSILIQAFDTVYRSDSIASPAYYLQNLSEDIKSTVYQTSQQLQCVQSSTTLFPYYNFGIKPKLVQQQEQKQDSHALQYAPASNGGTYRINIKNQSGRLHMVSLYQTDPSGVFLPLIWRKVPIANASSGSFNWNLKWGLSFGNSVGSTLKAGVKFVRSGEVINIDSSTSQNSASITYDKVDGFKISGPTQQALPGGVLGIALCHKTL